MKQRDLNQSKYKIRNWIRHIESTQEILMAILVVMIVTHFVGAHNSVPSGSMIPTIMIGDHLLTNKMPYYYRDPKRGEVVVFEQDDEKLVKRVIGLPGDVLDIRDNKVWINGEVLDEQRYIYVWDSTWQVAGMGISYPLTIPKNHYFVMGDNRSESLDSRYFGPIDRKQIISKASLRIYPFTTIGPIE